MPKFNEGQRVIVTDHGAGVVIEVEQYETFTSYAVDFDNGNGFWCAEWELSEETK